MQTAAHTSVPHNPHIRSITLNHPWHWLSAGWADMCANPGVSYLYGGLFTAIGFGLFYGLDAVGMGYLILPLVFGFALIGPVAAVGLYETSRRQQDDCATGLGEALAAIRRNPTQIALVGTFLLIAFLAWVRLAMLEFMLFFGSAPPSLDRLIDTMLLSPQSLAFLLVGLVSGGMLALGVFAMTAIAVPMLLHRTDCDAMTAMLTSVDAVRRNWRPMMLWAGLISFFTMLGMALFFVGLIVTLPLIGHASWHAYRDLVE
ncbi:MAG: hypothetical protein FD176_3470 [Rhodospirillaceae bacterium]|nr:MAG: hypothetical protein FD176_3470 [Rhodospirillaceae bacterium]TNC98123.1 MAG: Uncharacterized protein FD119_606 [Stygiobacter sp.]